jgi:hypothetical protein
VSARPPAALAVLALALALGGAWQALLILVFLVAFVWADEITQAAGKALSKTMAAALERARQRRELNLRRLELGAALARQAWPVPCAHEHPEDVRDLTGNLVARLCPQCETQLPPDFEPMKEDRHTRP